MLHGFIAQHGEEIISLARAKMVKRNGPRPTTNELEHGVPMFLRGLQDRLRNREDPTSGQIGASATLYGGELLAAGLTIGQVVHGYGDVCQSVTGLAGGGGASRSIPRTSRP